VFRAVAEAHLETGVPITTHSHSGSKGGLEQQRLLGELGVDLARVVIGHAGDSTDVAYLEERPRPGRWCLRRPPVIRWAIRRQSPQ
jgi:phosphotriesterase-related protein